MTSFPEGFRVKTSIQDGWRWSILIGLLILPGLVVADPSVMRAVQGWRWPPLVDLMQVLTWLGYGAVDIGGFLALAAFGWARLDTETTRRGLVGAATVAAAGLLDQVVKNVVCRARPTAPGAGIFFAHFPCFPAAYAYASFPSGHATTAFATAVLLGLWYPRWTGLYVGLASLVGLSRTVLGSHFPSDVLAGALLGVAVALVVHARIPAARRRREAMHGESAMSDVGP
jgi:undecaprenyl-diphosphatase